MIVDLSSGRRTAVIVLNLPSRPDRRREMRADLADIGIDPDDPRVTWFPAVDPRTPAGFSNSGHRGCLLSHQLALSLAAQRGYERTIILEDDCEFLRGAEPFALLGTLDDLDSRWDLAYLGHPESVRSAAGPWACWTPERSVRLTHCYAARAAVAAELAAYLAELALRPPGSPGGGPMSIDGAISWYRKYHPYARTYLSAPSIARQRSSRSDLSPRPWDRVPGLAAVAGAARRLRRWARGGPGVMTP